MKKTLLLVCLVLFAISAFAIGEDDIAKQDTNDVKSLNKQALDERLTDPAQTTLLGKKSLQLAQKLNYDSGIAEAYRVTGIGQYYLNQLNQAIASYMSALTYFQKINDLRGEAAVYNNIGNLYRDNDNIRSKEYFDKALSIGIPLSDKSLIAKTYLNMGNLYFRNQSFNKALNYYNQAEALFSQLKDSVDIIQCSENRGNTILNSINWTLQRKY
jgi:tetratricopeptide (TPR) repeat protein